MEDIISIKSLYTNSKYGIENYYERQKGDAIKTYEKFCSDNKIPMKISDRRR